MTVPQASLKVAVSVREMAEMCSISRTRWYELMATGVFPKPVRVPSMRRPIYDRSQQEKCLEIRRTGIGANGQPVLFNRKPAKSRMKSRPQSIDTSPQIMELLDALKELGLNTNAQAVEAALAQLFPSGCVDLDRGDVIRKVFLHLQGGKK